MENGHLPPTHQNCLMLSKTHWNNCTYTTLAVLDAGHKHFKVHIYIKIMLLFVVKVSTFYPQTLKHMLLLLSVLLSRLKLSSCGYYFSVKDFSCSDVSVFNYFLFIFKECNHIIGEKSSDVLLCSLL